MTYVLGSMLYASVQQRGSRKTDWIRVPVEREPRVLNVLARGGHVSVAGMHFELVEHLGRLVGVPWNRAALGELSRNGIVGLSEL